MKKINIYFLLLAFFVLSACQNQLEKHDFQSTQIGFDTFIQFRAYTKNEEDFQYYKEIVTSTFIHYDELFDKYDSVEGVNNIKTINDFAGVKPVIVDPEIIEMLELAILYDEKSDGAFNITLGPVLELWHDAREIAEDNPNNAYIPDQNVLKMANACTGLDLLEIDKEASTVYLNQPCASLDVGGIAKGYAVEKVAQKLVESGLETGLINAGGNVRIIGEKPDDSSWTVGVQKPELESISSSLLNVSINGDVSFVTSGDYQRFYLYNGEMVHHIIDPTTLHPSHYAKSITVISKDSGIADAISTILFTINYEDGLQFINTLQQEGMDIECIWVFDQAQLSLLPDGTNVVPVQNYYVVSTPALEEMIELLP